MSAHRNSCFPVVTAARALQQHKNTANATSGSGPSGPEPAPGQLFALALASISLIGPLAVHLFMPVIPAVKIALGLSEASAQLTFSIALYSMAFATLMSSRAAWRANKRECRDALASVELKQAPEVAVLRNESREFFD